MPGNHPTPAATWRAHARDAETWIAFTDLARHLAGRTPAQIDDARRQIALLSRCRETSRIN